MVEDRTSKQRVAVVVRDDTGFRFEVAEHDVPTIQPWEVLVKLTVSGVCGTDILMASGKGGPARDILGHEGIGRVVAVGEGVIPGTVEIGARVGIAWVRDICGVCRSCRLPDGETRCVEQFNSGRKWDGTFAEYCVVPSRYILSLPDELDLPDEVLAPIVCGGVTAYKALKICDARPGEWVAVPGGGGGVGALGVQFAKAMGYRVIAIDVGQEKEDLCQSLGVEAYFDARQEDLVEAVSKVTEGKGAKAAIVAAGSNLAYQSALQYLGAAGTLVSVGIPPPDQRVSFHPLELIDRGVRIDSVAVGTRNDTLEAIDFLRRGLVKPQINLTTLEELNEISKRVATSTGRWVIRF
ncbi:alcohol dehydrogenase [Thozetella sp. PMI_491]|nr:alcohol dehydrogenase [Thozetella sp. PMI_491]